MLPAIVEVDSLPVVEGAFELIMEDTLEAFASIAVGVDSQEEPAFAVIVVDSLEVVGIVIELVAKDAVIIKFAELVAGIAAELISSVEE